MSPATFSRFRILDEYRPAAGLILVVLILATLLTASPVSAEPDQQELAVEIIDLMKT